VSLTYEETGNISIPDLSDPATYADAVPRAAFAEIQRRPGLHWVPTTIANKNGGYWAVTRYDEIVEIEKDPATFSSTGGPAFPYTNISSDHPSVDMIMCTDPPRHNYLRRAAAKGFSPRIVRNFEPWVREVVTQAIDAVEGRSEFDYVEEFARTIPAYVIATVLGAPREDRAYLVKLLTDFFDAAQHFEGLEEGEGTSDRVIPLLGELTEYAARMQKVKLAQPGDDMFTELIGCVERDEITQAEYLQWMFVMIAAGFETTHTTIGQSMRMYLEEPDVRALTDKGVEQGETGRVVDEYLRVISPVIQMARTATRDLTFSGERIRENDVMVLYYIAANRDPAVFSDPDRFDPWRPEMNMLAFGTGVHRCLGAHLAKLELTILWEELRARDVRLELAGEPRRGWSNYINILTELPVRRV
jgi:cholest-4-en-3-one 26-monooxygenase